MNICFVALSFRAHDQPASGISAQVRVLGKSLAAAGHSVSVVTLGSRSETVNDEGLQVFYVPSSNLHWYLSRLPLIGKWVAAPVREIEYSIAGWKGVRRAQRISPIQLIEGTETGMLLASFWKHCPAVIRLHGERYTFDKYTPGMTLTAEVRLTRLLQRIALRRVAMLASPSQAHADEIRKEISGLRPGITVLANSIEVDKLEPAAEPQPKLNTVLFVGRIEPLKGVVTLLEAASQAKQQIPDIRFVFAGGFSEKLPRAEFYRLVRQHGLEPYVEDKGAVSRDVLYELYQQSALVVLPSHYETFGVAAVEAMCFAKPVVATRAGALPEVIEDGITGVLVDDGDAGGLSNAIVLLLKDPELVKAMGSAARARASRQFSIARNLESNLDFYRKVLSLRMPKSAEMPNRIAASEVDTCTSGS